MASKLTRRFLPLVTASLLILLGLAVALAQALYIPENPFPRLLDTLPTDAVCYPEISYTFGYCIQRFDYGDYISYGIDSDGLIRSVSVRGVFNVRVGDLIADFGQPDKEYENRYYTSWFWYCNGFRVVAFSRKRDLWQRVNWLIVSRGQ